ncbi:MAG: hypothetical protein K6A35_00910 [bacterium]|nr:hypothetical protein [bacterium]
MGKKKLSSHKSSAVNSDGDLSGREVEVSEQPIKYGHGGKRPGSGRKIKYGARLDYHIRVSGDEKDSLTAAREMGINQKSLRAMLECIKKEHDEASSSKGSDAGVVDSLFGAISCAGFSLFDN